MSYKHLSQTELNSYLIKASQNGHTNTVERLLDCGADIHTNNGKPLYVAFKCGRIFTVRFLVSRGADIHDAFLPRAAKDGNNSLIKHLLAHGIDIHTNNDAALRAAARYSCNDTVELLLRHGANIHADDDNSLKTAVKLGRGYIVETLLAHGADVHAGNNNALITAAELGHCYIAKLLLIHGADIHADNDAALRIAAKNGHKKMVWLLLMRGANIHANNDEALKLAAKGYCINTDSLSSVFTRVSDSEACFDGAGDYANTVVRLAQHYLSIGKKSHLDSLLPTLPESAADLIGELLQDDNLSA